MSIDLALAYPPRWLDSPPALPQDRPFGRQEALDLGASDKLLMQLTASGYLRHPVRGAYHVPQLEDGLGLRLACLALLVPEDAVVTDRSAAWLFGAPMALAPNDHLVVPRVSIFRPPGYRLRNKISASGERTFSDLDLAEMGGLRVTTPLRTACDLGRLLHRDQAFAGMDAVVRAAGLQVARVVDEVERFRGYRHVRQLRALAPWVDGRSESPGESILRLRWLDCARLPPPTPQLEVPGRWGPLFLDLGVWRPRYAAEYDGTEWHGPERHVSDRERREWLRREAGFVIDVFRAADIHGRTQNAEARLLQGFERASAR